MGVVLAADLFPQYESLNIPWKPWDPAFVATNPSIISTDHRSDGSRWRMVARCINYRLGEVVPNPAYSKNVSLGLTNDLGGVYDVKPMIDLSGRVCSDYPIHGFEDCRVFHWQGRLWATATCCDLTPTGNREICLLELASNFAISRVIPLRGPWSSFYQKNWIPCPVGQDLALIYSVDRSLVLFVNHALEISPFAMERGVRKHVNDVKWRDTGIHRGSSQGVPIGDEGGWMFIVHEPGYRSRFVMANDQFRPVLVSDFFKFRDKTRVEFCAGLALDGEQLIASYSVHDSSTELAFIPMASVMGNMRMVQERELWTA